MNPRRIAALRAMHADCMRRLKDGETDPHAAIEGAMLGGALVGFIPELLDEIERLQTRREPARLLKMDSQGGNA